MADRRRRRKDSLKVKKRDIVDRVLKFYDDDLTSTQLDRDARLQRYAKYRMWTEGKDWPWEDASDIALPDMMEKSLRLQDTLHNAVMTQRPPIGSKALKKADRDKQKTVDDLIDFQFFVEQDGEGVVGDLADAFVNDGVYTVFVPWVTERREAADVRLFEPIPDELSPEDYFSVILRREFPNKIVTGSGWDYRLVGDETFLVSFYTRDDDSVEMIVKRPVTMFDGPKPIVKDYEDVFHPARAQNLQIPGPSNPNGASHVILRDYPTVDEIKRLASSGFYDLLTAKDRKALENATRVDDDAEKGQKDAFEGKQDANPHEGAKSHRTLTRLLCFDTFDIDGDGIDEDVIWWVILEARLLVKARLLTEMYPAVPPRRPFAESAFIPVRGRRTGISLLEMMEGVHDMMKTLYDQTIDGGTIKNAPFFFYRPSSSIKPEVIRLWPGEGYPLADPQRDINFPSFPTDQGFGINMITLLGQMEERLTMIGDLQLGRVPAGRSAALRTVGGMALLAGQGEARPERILRRFFTGLAEIWHQIHELNQHFLPKDKQIRISGLKSDNEDPYQTITTTDEIRGRFQFDFTANVLNTTKAAFQQSLTVFGQTFVTELAIQLGITKPEGVYRWMRDQAKSLGLDPDNYLTEPVPGARNPKIFAEDAISAIMNTTIPEGDPLEGATAHLERLQEFFASDQFGLLTPPQIEIFRTYAETVAEKAAQEQQQAQLLQAAQAFQQREQPSGVPAGQTAPEGAPQISGEAELIDETLPGAQGLQ